MENKLWYLRKNRLFERASDEVVSYCEHLFVQKEYQKRKTLFEQGDSARIVYLLKRGKVRLMRTTEDGKDVTLAILGPGDIFGEEVVFEDVERKTVAVCMEDSLLCMARAEDLYALMTRYPILAMNVARFMRDQRDDALSVVEEVAYLKVPERLLRLFERLAAEYGVADGPDTLIDVRLTHADIASLIGSTRETVTAQLSLLAKDGHIRMQGRSIVLTARAAV